jgi:hypothetical protein
MSNETFDRRDKFCMWLLDQGFPADFVMHHAHLAGPSGHIWNEQREALEVFQPPAPPPTPEQLRYLGQDLEWHGED